MPTVTVLSKAKEPPTPNVAVPALPVVPLSAPEAAEDVRETARVSVPPLRVMLTDAGALMVKAWPPSPPTEKVARVGEDVASEPLPAPLRARAPVVASTVMVFVPVPGRIIEPNARSVVLLSEIGLRTDAVVVAEAVAVDCAEASPARESAAKVNRVRERFMPHPQEIDEPEPSKLSGHYLAEIKSKARRVNIS